MEKINRVRVILGGVVAGVIINRSASERKEYYSHRQVPATVREEVESLLRFDRTSEHCRQPNGSKKEALPVSSMSLGGRMQPENHGSATIGKAVKVVGKIYSKEDLLIAAQLGTFLRENDASPREPGRLALFGYFAQRFKVAYR